MPPSRVAPHGRPPRSTIPPDPAPADRPHPSTSTETTMRKLMLAIALLCPSALAGCAGYSTTVGNLTAAQPDITNDISLACQSADGLLRLAATKVANATIASAASRLAAGVNTSCTKAINE